MASTKTKGKRRVARKKTNYKPWIIGVAVIAAIIAIPRLYGEFQIRTATGDFAQYVREGRGEFAAKQEVYADLGRNHVAFGTDVAYNSSPATSGSHYGSWVNPGFYSAIQEEKQLVHSLEHGNVIAYYGDVPDETLNMLEDWTLDFRGAWDGFIAAPLDDIGEGVVLTAWRHTLRLDPFEPALAAAFIDRHRGRGPENKVR